MTWIILFLFFSASLGIALGIGHCCCGCAIFSDSYGSDLTGIAYTIFSGTWTVAGGNLSTTSANAAMRTQTPMPVGSTGVYSKVTLSISNTGATVRLGILVTDSNNYWFAEAQPGATNGTLKLFQRSGGVNTQKGSTTTINGFITSENWELHICYQGGYVVAGMTDNPATVPAVNSITFNSGVITVAGTYGLLGTGAMAAGTSTFDDYSIETHKLDDDSCLSCTYCASCINGDEPFRIKVVVSGITNQLCGGVAGANQNGEWIYQRTTACRWEWVGSPTVTGVAAPCDSVLFTASGGGRPILLRNNSGINADMIAGGGSSRWRKILATPFAAQDCHAWVSLQLDNDIDSDTNYVLGASKVYVTSL